MRQFPDEDTPRLAYADWLDEQGQSERAEFIRVECRTANPPWTSKDMIRGANLWLQLKEGFRQSLPPFSDPGYRWTLHATTPSETINNTAIVRRGFVDEIRCELADWYSQPCARRVCRSGRVAVNQWTTKKCISCRGTGFIRGVGPAIAMAHPVRRVVLIDRAPTHFTFTDRHGWIMRRDDGLGDYSLPWAMGKHLPGAPKQFRPTAWQYPVQFKTPQEAIDGASEAALAWARDAAHANNSSRHSAGSAPATG